MCEGFGREASFFLCSFDPPFLLSFDQLRTEKPFCEL